jgi:hypothetical protein
MRKSGIVSEVCKTLLLICAVAFVVMNSATASEVVPLAKGGEILESSPALLSPASDSARVHVQTQLKSKFKKSWSTKGNCLKLNDLGSRERSSCLELGGVYLSGDRVFFSLKGKLIDKDGTVSDCHGCPGTFVLGVLEVSVGRKSGNLKLSEPFFGGSWGEPPNLRSLQLGKNGPYGWVYASGFTGFGSTTLSLSFHALRGVEFKEIGFADLGGEDPETCDEKDYDRSCLKIRERSISLRYNQPHKIGELIIDQSEQRFKDNKPISNATKRQLVIKFDERLDKFPEEVPQ